MVDVAGSAANHIHHCVLSIPPESTHEVHHPAIVHRAGSVSEGILPTVGLTLRNSLHIGFSIYVVTVHIGLSKQQSRMSTPRPSQACKKTVIMSNIG
jgi:hypothetical protein